MSQADTDIDPKTGHARDQVQVSQTGTALVLRGALTVRSVTNVMRDLDQMAQVQDIDISGLTRFDTAGAYLLDALRRDLGQSGRDIRFTGVNEDQQALLDLVARARPEPAQDAPHRKSLNDYLETVGRAVVGAGRFFSELAAMLGLFLVRSVQMLRHPARFPMTALVYHSDQVGWRAVPIVALMAFLIGVVMAFQGAVQLRQFGAEIFVVELIAISILRELGILLTAIIVAGRTASSFTAAIGSMKMREEIDAMNTLAIDPARVLFVPRILALLITLPILGLIANVVGIFGGAMMAWIELGITPAMFLARLLDEIGLNHVIVGFVKAPVFAIIIGVIGCHAGMQVQGNAESLGRQTSAAVVRAIFAVILADALFSIFFAMVDL